MFVRVAMALVVAAGLYGLAPSTTSFAQEKKVTAKEKKGTCEFGADDQKLQGAERKAFITKCMANDGPVKKAKPKTKKQEEKKSDG